jgi:lysophospholipase L1-like esterase
MKRKLAIILLAALLAIGTLPALAQGRGYGAQASSTSSATLSNSLAVGPVALMDTPATYAAATPWDRAYPAAGSADFPGGSATASFESVITSYDYRIRQDGDVERAVVRIEDTTALTGFYIKVWRLDGGLFQLVGTSQNLASSLVAATTVTAAFTAPFAAKVGDMVGYRIEWSGGAPVSLFRKTAAGIASWDEADAASAATGYAWASKTAGTECVTFTIQMRSPNILAVGDSIMAGGAVTLGILEGWGVNRYELSGAAIAARALGGTVQNLAQSGYTVAEVDARVTTTLTALAPSLAILNGGVNDITAGTLKATFLAEWASILGSCSVEGVKPCVVAIAPWIGGTHEQYQTADDWNASLQALVGAYSGAVFVDPRPYLGQFHAGGDAGNLWDLQAAFSYDGTHYNARGHEQYARAIVDALSATTVAGDATFANATVSGQLVAGSARAGTLVQTQAWDPADPPAKALKWSDEFTATTLSPSWAFYGGTVPATVDLATHGGWLHLSNGGTARTAPPFILYQPVTSFPAAFTIKTRVSIPNTYNYYGVAYRAGLVILDSNGTGVYCGINGCSSYAEYGAVTTWTTWGAASAVGGITIPPHLAIKRDTTFFGATSYDGISWEGLMPSTASFTVAYVGMYWFAPADPVSWGRNCDFEYFRVE